jgi:hypothetical protein
MQGVITIRPQYCHGDRPIAVEQTARDHPQTSVDPSGRSAILRVGVALFWFASLAPQSFGQKASVVERPYGMLAGRDSIGREVSSPFHLFDGQEFSQSLPALLSEGRALFNANWTEQEGGGRPQTKGTGRPLSDAGKALVGIRGWNRISGPDANSCAGCHNQLYGIAGGSGDFVTNVFVLGQRFDSASFDPSDKLPTRDRVDESGEPCATILQYDPITAAFLPQSDGIVSTASQDLSIVAPLVNNTRGNIPNVFHLDETKQVQMFLPYLGLQ